MQEKCEMPDLGEMTYFLGLEVNQAHNAIFINQKGFAIKILRRYSMENYKPMSTPIAQDEKRTSSEDVEKLDETSYRCLVGCSLYLTASRPDIMFVVSLLSRFMHCCNVDHYKVVKRVLRYMRGTLDHGVKFTRTEKVKLLGYSDSDWGGSSEDMKITLGYFFTLRSNVFYWSSKK
ncbi:uncharacterized mitochondrial protein AtMg00810-like [Gossypium arboreum]|uniref:uncharacterized mitochondrial protein AtMg00810-like n=1 Tax=Gossypium arboreum TaxID=29729 RepID=UPI00081948E8|nr:uncharacterized mitochondrial protein AtMg00810-like [Gossypium arboreum]